METIGWAALQVIPTMQGVEGNMSGQLVGPMRTAGKRAGQAAGDGIAAGIAGAKAAVEKATSDLSKSQDKVADAAGKRRVAEAALVDAAGEGHHLGRAAYPRGRGARIRKAQGSRGVQGGRAGDEEPGRRGGARGEGGRRRGG
ncbi:hypothetical protein GS432_18710 [Rhodococcus hoagii]|nr:hypothetical protein [Prescottella equi]